MQTRTAEGTATSSAASAVPRDWSWTIARHDGPVSHQDLSPLFKLWQSKSQPEVLPDLEDFSIAELVPWLGNLSIARPIGDDFELELLGCSVTDQHGREISRVSLSEAKFGPVGTEAREMLETVTDMGIIALPCGSTYWRGQCFGWHGIALPLAGQSALISLFVLQ